MTAVRVSQLCADGDTFLRGRDLEKATSLYMSAFRTHAVSAVSHMRKLDDLSLGQVVSTLESWLDGSGDIQPNGGLNKGLAAVFLSTLCPNNLTATIFKMESLLQNGGHNSEEICARCTTLLEGKRSPRPEGPTRVLLEITQALACLFSEPRGSTGLRLYLQTYQRNKPETVKLVQSRQAAHLPRIVKSFTDQIMQTRPSLAFDSKWAETTKEHDKLAIKDSSAVIDFLSAVLPADRDVQELKAVYLFSSGRFGDSAEAYTALLRQEQNIPESATDASASPERTARLLTSRAAACLSAGGRSAEECRDLQAAFEIHPATARIHFQRLFADLGAGQAARNHLRQQAERGLSAFRERVLGRADLRATDGVELLDPVISALRTLCHLEADGGGRELRVRLADCLLLRGEHKEALSICSQLAAAQGQQSYQNTVQVLCGYARLLSGDHQGALEDFQAVIEHNAPHPSSCVRALCGRGLLRLMGGFNYLTGLDYVTASVLHPQETALTVRCLVPWNRRGLLVTVLLEQGRVMLEGKAGHKSKSASSEDPPQSKREGQLQAPSKRENHTQIMTPAGVQSLAALLTELQPGADGPQILAADSLYLLGRVEEAYRLLLSVGTPNPRAPVLARLALLQLHRGFLYDTNQLLKKLIVCGDTSCLRSLLAVAQEKDRAALQRHCHSAAKRILDGSKGESSVREAVAYLSIAIMASGGDAADSLLERARCYVLLGQRKTAIFDFSAILREKPKHMHGLCGRGFTHLMLNQQKECIQDVLAALQINTDIVIKEVLSLKDRARKLLCDWLHHFCRTNLSDTVTANSVPCHEEQLRDAFTIGGALLRTDSRDPRWHLLYVDTLLAKGEFKAASTHLCQVFGQEPRDAVAQARLGVVEAWQQNYCSATRRLSKVIEKESSSLDFLLALIPFNQRKCTAQAAAQEASGVSSAGQWDQALALLTVAVKAAGDHKLLYLRQRAACFSQLGLHEQAVADLDRVIRRHGDSSCSDDLKIRAEDLCRRGRSLVLCSREGAALEDFSQALSLHRMQMVQCAEAGPGRLHLAECFLRGALQRYEEQQLSEAWRLIECGLAVDGENAELRRLRARVKREATGPCNIN